MSSLRHLLPSSPSASGAARLRDRTCSVASPLIIALSLLPLCCKQFRSALRRYRLQLVPADAGWLRKTCFTHAARRDSCRRKGGRPRRQACVPAVARWRCFAHDAVGRAADYPAGAQRTAPNRDAGRAFGRAAACGLGARRHSGIAVDRADRSNCRRHARHDDCGDRRRRTRRRDRCVDALRRGALSAFGVAIMQPGMPTLVREWLPNRIAVGTISY